MRSLMLLAVCGALVLASCSGSDTGESDTSPVETDAPDASSGESAAESEAPVTSAPPADESATPPECVSADIVSAAAGVEATFIEAVAVESDSIGFDPAAGATSCGYEFAEVSQLVVTLHNSPINTSFLQDLPPDLAVVTDLDSGAIQLQFDGVPGCEVYGDQSSVVVFADSEDIDSCGIASSVHDLVVS